MNDFDTLSLAGITSLSLIGPVISLLVARAEGWRLESVNTNSRKDTVTYTSSTTMFVAVTMRLATPCMVTRGFVEDSRAFLGRH